MGRGVEFQDVGLAETDLQAQAAGITTGCMQCIGRDVGGCYFCLWIPVLQGKCYASAAGPEVDDAVGMWMVDATDEVFGLGSGYEHRGVDINGESAKLGMPHHILHWLALLQALCHVVDTGHGVGIEMVVVACQHMGCVEMCHFVEQHKCYGCGRAVIVGVVVTGEALQYVSVEVAHRLKGKLKGS